jgi:hypothetical protein
VIARPAVIWHGSWYKHLTRRARRRYAPPALLPLAPAGPDGPAGQDPAPLPAAALAPAPGVPTGHAWQSNGDGQPAAVKPDRRRPPRARRAWDGTGGAS